MKEEEAIAKRLRWTRIRILCIAPLLLLAAGKIMARTFEVQITKNDEYTRRAREQQLRSVRLPPSRGPILDRNGNELAISVMVPSIYVNPEEVRDKVAASSALAAALSLSQEEVLKKVTSKKTFVWIKRRTTEEEASSVRELKLEGVGITYESKRFYPNRRLASHVLGFAGYDAEGLEGIEFEFNKQLLDGRPLLTGLRDAHGRMIFPEGVGNDPIRSEKKLVLSIDKAIQSIVEEELAKFVRLFEAKAAAVVVVRPTTGEILALANQPDFNPNLYWKSSPDQRRNRAVTDRFEPGSTMKIFSMAAAIDTGSIKLTDLFYCNEGELRIDDLLIRDARRNEWLSPMQIIQRSSNVGITKIMFQTGKENLYSYLRRFGFGEKTGIQYPGETPGLLRHHSQWYNVDFASISFGHGIGVSALQLAMAVSAIANEGKLLRPLLVKKIISPEGTTIKEFKPQLIRRVVEKKTASILSRMMVSVTQDGGTGREAAIDGFTVSGKTGTAQKPDTISGGYAEDRWIASFVGFVPSEQPELAMAILFDEPLINYYGGVVAAPLFKKIGERSLRYLGIMPRGTPAGAILDKAPREVETKKGIVAIEPVGSEELQPLPSSKEAGVTDAQAIPASPVAIAAASCTGDCVAVPDFSGIGVPDAINKGFDAGVRVEILGSGRALWQSIPPSILVPRGGRVTVKFGPPSR